MTVIPNKHTFTIWQGASFNETLALYTNTAGTTPKDLTGYTAEMIIRAKPKGAAVTSPTGSYSTGTASLASTGVVTGVGTAFTPGMVGGTFTISSVGYVITSYTNATSITVTNSSATVVATTNYSIVYNGGVTASVDVANSKINLSLTATQTAAITWTGAVYDLTINKTSTGAIDAILYGAIKVQGV